MPAVVVLELVPDVVSVVVASVVVVSVVVVSDVVVPDVVVPDVQSTQSATHETDAFGQLAMHWPYAV